MGHAPLAKPSIAPHLHGANMGCDIWHGHGWKNAQGIHHTMMFACFKGLFIPKGWWNLVESVWEFVYGPSKKIWSLCQNFRN